MHRRHAPVDFPGEGILREIGASDVLRILCDGVGLFSAETVGEEPERHVHPGREPGRRVELAVDAPAGALLPAHGGKSLQGHRNGVLVRRRAAPVQKSRAPEKDRTRANREHPGRLLGQGLDACEEFGRKLQPLRRRSGKKQQSLGIGLFHRLDGDGNALRAFHDARNHAVETNVVDARVSEHFDGTHRVDRFETFEKENVEGRLFRVTRRLRGLFFRSEDRSVRSDRKTGGRTLKKRSARKHEESHLIRKVPGIL